MKYLTWSSVLFISGIILPSQSLAYKINCPRIINTTQSLKDRVNGWETFVDIKQAEYSLSYVSFYDGHPSENASLAPDNETMKTNKMIWRFQGDNFWIACSYRDTTIQLIQKLPNKTKKCFVLYNNRNFIKSISCN